MKCGETVSSCVQGRDCDFIPDWATAVGSLSSFSWLIDKSCAANRSCTLFGLRQMNRLLLFTQTRQGQCFSDLLCEPEMQMTAACVVGLSVGAMQS